MNNINCDACRQPIASQLYLQCYHCKGTYHRDCLNISKDQFLSLTSEIKASWTCPSCANITRRTRCTLNTPVRRGQLPFDTEESMNMSLDLDRGQVTAAGMVTPKQNIISRPHKVDDAVTMEKISKMFDEKLESAMSAILERFRMSLQEQVKQLVSSELASTINDLKEDFNASINFISDEQSSLQSQIKERNESIKILETENSRLQNDITKLNGRILSFEKVSRSQNLEIQAVPESRHENVVTLFKKLCDTVQVTIDDSNIHACRRVAKMDARSKRPRNILVTLSSPRLRDTVLSAVHRYNKTHSKETLNSINLGIPGETRKIYVTEHLSPECKYLHAEARKEAKEKGYKFVWVKYGRVYVRKNEDCGCIYIRDSSSLSKMSNV